MRVVRKIAQDNNLNFKKRWFSKSLIASGVIAQESVKLIAPVTFMNLVGRAVSQLMKAEKIEPNNFLVICDDINLDLGKIRIRASGSDGGHNGLKSITEALGTTDFPRLRIGIAAPDNKERLSEYVLSNFSRKEEEEIAHCVSLACECCVSWIRDGIAAAMSKFN
jgi:PTH1 family peptidyl-tRNA hydrolase